MWWTRRRATAGGSHCRDFAEPEWDVCELSARLAREFRLLPKVLDAG